MKLIIELFGETRATQAYNNLVAELPNMHEDYYVRNIIRTLDIY